MKFFPHIDIMMAKSTLNPSDQDTEGLPKVNIFLNLFNNWLLVYKYVFTLPLENFIFLYCCNRTTNLLVNYYEVFY